MPLGYRVVAWSWCLELEPPADGLIRVTEEFFDWPTYTNKQTHTLSVQLNRNNRAAAMRGISFLSSYLMF